MPTPNNPLPNMTRVPPVRDPHVSHETFTSENFTVTRVDIQNYLEVGTPLTTLATILTDKGMSKNEIDKIFSDLPSYN